MIITGISIDEIKVRLVSLRTGCEHNEHTVVEGLTSQSGISFSRHAEEFVRHGASEEGLRCNLRLGTTCPSFRNI